ncbi:MAG TPA: hypothetical protein VE242_06415, partial [Chthoniobacterales bacterium]|nr:hypothetical protein [Chthoniobacterales bacterium]
SGLLGDRFGVSTFGAWVIVCFSIRAVAFDCVQVVSPCYAAPMELIAIFYDESYKDFAPTEHALTLEMFNLHSGPSGR